MRLDSNSAAPPASAVPSSVHVLHALVQFVRVVRYRKHYPIGALAVTSLLGLLYYATAERIYQAQAQLLVQQLAPVVTSPLAHQDRAQGNLPTYERLFTTTVVLEGAVKRLTQMPRPLRVDLIAHPSESWVAILRDNLSVRSFRMTDVIEISYRSRSPEAAEAVVSAIVDAYLEFIEQNHRNVATDLVEILQKEREQVETRLKQQEQELLAAMNRLGDMGLSKASHSLPPLVQRAVKVNDTLIEVQQNRLKLQASLFAIRAAIQQGEDLRQHLISVEPIIGREVVLAALGLSEQDGRVVAQLEKQVIDDQARLDAMRAHFGPRHPKIMQLSEAIQQNQVYLANYQQAVNQRVQRLQGPPLQEMLLSMVGQELAKVWSHERELQREYDAAQAAAVQAHSRFEEIAMRKREVDRLLQLNDTLLDRISSIDINQNQSDVRVEPVSAPKASPRPVAPRSLIVVVVCLGAGLSIGCGLVYLADVLDDRFRSPEEMKNQLGVPVLALVRQLVSGEGRGLDALQVYQAPDAIESEAFRTLRTTLAFMGEGLECVAISSSEPGDGKTTIVANLGLAFADAGRRTLLIDADLRRPGLSRLFDLRGQRGLSDVLQDRGEVDQAAASCICSAGVDHLDILPCGPRPLDPTGLLVGSRFGELLAWAETRYDQVLIDSPPVLVASDAAVVGRMASGLLLVVQPQKNHRRLVVRAIEELRSTGLNLVGVIANRLTPQTGEGYYGPGYGYAEGDEDGYDQDGTDEVDMPPTGTSAAPPASSPAQRTEADHQVQQTGQEAAAGDQAGPSSAPASQKPRRVA